MFCLGLDARIRGVHAHSGLIGVDRSTVLYWRQTGLLPGIRDPHSGTWWFLLPPELAEKLRNRPRIDRSKSRLSEGKPSRKADGS